MSEKIPPKDRKSLNAIDLSATFKELVKWRVSTGIVAFDKAIGGGIPGSKLTELYGDFSTGKSRLALHIIAETQKMGGVGVYIDNERSLEKGLVDLTGVSVDPNKFIYPDPDKILSIEDVFDQIQNSIDILRERHKGYITIVWDSVAATPGMEDLEKSIGRAEASMRRAKVIGDGLRKIIIEVYTNQIALIFINQIRDKIGVMFGEKTETVGGRALKFAASLRMHMKIHGGIKNETTREMDGYKAELVVDKNKTGRPFRKVFFEMYADKPFDPLTGLLDYLVRHGQIEDLGRRKFSVNVAGKKEEFHETEFPDVWERYSASLKTEDE